MRNRLALLLGFIAILVAQTAAAATGGIGIVLMHGKGGTPTGHIGALASALQQKGYLVSTPAMPWSKDRIYDASFDDALREIDREVDALKRNGAKRVVVAGQSLGANVALGYGAARDHVDAIIALSPGHNPDAPAFARRLGTDVSRARELIAAGKGRDKQSFSDLNQGQLMRVTATAEIYLTWLDPDGRAVMAKSAASFKAPTPLLVLVGNGDRTAPAPDEFFTKAPPHPGSRFITLSAGHFDLPDVAAAAVADWLRTLSEEWAASGQRRRELAQAGSSAR
jgi:dienelactone hydrolase